jgi:hypothetical protein
VVIGLSEIDFHKIGTGMTGPVTRSLQQGFQDAIHGKSAAYIGWRVWSMRINRPSKGLTFLAWAGRMPH